MKKVTDMQAAEPPADILATLVDRHAIEALETLGGGHISGGHGHGLRCALAKVYADHLNKTADPNKRPALCP